jgi:hypothetical protein
MVVVVPLPVVLKVNLLFVDSGVLFQKLVCVICKKLKVFMFCITNKKPKNFSKLIRISKARYFFQSSYMMSSSVGEPAPGYGSSFYKKKISSGSDFF